MSDWRLLNVSEIFVLTSDLLFKTCCKDCCNNPTAISTSTESERRRPVHTIGLTLIYSFLVCSFVCRSPFRNIYTTNGRLLTRAGMIHFLTRRTSSRLRFIWCQGVISTQSSLFDLTLGKEALYFVELSELVRGRLTSNFRSSGLV